MFTSAFEVVGVDAAAVGAVFAVLGAAYFMWKFMKFMDSAMQLMKQINGFVWSMSEDLANCRIKLNFLEHRMEGLTQTGDETARHLVQIVHEYDAELARWSLRWPLRRTLEIFQTWRAARIVLQQECSKIRWNLVVQSALEWVQSEVEELEWSNSAEDMKMASRLKKTAQMFQTHIGEFWGGSGVENVMLEFATMENSELCRKGMLGSHDEGHSWSNGVAFRSKYLREPNGDFQEGTGAHTSTD